MNNRKYLNMLPMMFLFFGVFNLNATANSMANNSVIAIPLTDFLTDLSKNHKVFFTYNPTVVAGIKINLEEYQNSSLKEIITKLAVNTNLDFEYLGNNYYVIHPKKVKNIITHKVNTVKANFSTIKHFIELQHSVSGKVRDQNGLVLGGVNIIEKGTTNGTSSDFNGNYTIPVAKNATLIFSYIGFNTVEIDVNGHSKINTTLAEGLSLDEVTIVGSRNNKRTAIDTAVPVDIIDVAAVTTQSGKIEINELLQYAAPSFNASKQSGSDGADHIDPATLRGLGPDQTLILINGKRRHQSSLINIFGTRGRGNTGTDLNAIPAAAIKRIEILRDGAAAQYGSDAIAGVINVVLNDNTDRISGLVSYGAYNSHAHGNFPIGTPNTYNNRLATDEDGNQIDENKNLDGNALKVAANYGASIGQKGGYINATTEFIKKEKTLRPGYDFRRGFGEASIEGFNLFVNTAYPISEKSEIYAFGGRNYRDTDAFAFTRNQGERVVVSKFPNGFTPRITSNIIDNSLSVGIKSELKNGWEVDLSNSYGKNNFHYFIKGTLNASLEDASPTDFDAGGHSLSQNTINLDLSKYYNHILEGMNLAFGAEYRNENFIIFAGEPGSYGTFDTNGVLITDPSRQTQPIHNDSGGPRPGGSQGFPGYSPANEINRSRSNFSLYIDSEFDLSKTFLLNAASRYEHYSDFGSTLNGKLAARLKASKKMNIRASLSSGFRAPSLAQIYYNLKFTDYKGGIATETLLSPNNSPITKAFGIEQLKEETAFNAGLGFTANFGEIAATIDGYYIDVQNRIVLTEKFDASNLGTNVAEAQFFANAVDTKSLGFDVVLSFTKLLNIGKVFATLAGNVNTMKIDKVRNDELDTDTFFGAREKAFLLASAPKSKFAMHIGYERKKFNTAIAATRFSKITLIDFADTEDVYNAKITTDVYVGYKLYKNLNLNIGINNLFNTYPDAQTDGETESGGYWDSVQMGFGGTYYYSKLGFNF